MALFARHLPEESATFRETHKDTYRFASDFQHSAILADIYDSIQNMLYLFSQVHGGKPNKPQSYPRPWVDDKNVKRIGSGAIPISDFNEWYYGGDE